MISDLGKYYLYRYIRIDNNQPYYIGIGTKKTIKSNFRKFISEYRRAFTFHKENGIMCKSQDIAFNVEILLESNNYSFILEKEIEFINLYGRKNLKTGSLCNLTNGGEYNRGRIGKCMSQVNKDMHSKRMKDNNPNKDGSYIPTSNPLILEKVKKRMRTSNPRLLFLGENDIYAKKCYQYDLDGNFIKECNSQIEASKYYNLSSGSISNVCKETHRMTGNFMWRKEFLGENIEPYKKLYKPKIK